jgi:DNA-binding NarL/FixJ family response regulator
LIDFLRRQSGIEVIEQAKGGLGAISFTRLLAPHLVLLDISMSGLSGIQTANIIKKYSPGTKVVFVTIHDEETVRGLMGNLSVDGFVSKRNLKKDLPLLLDRMKRESLSTPPKDEQT